MMMVQWINGAKNDSQRYKKQQISKSTVTQKMTQNVVGCDGGAEEMHHNNPQH